MKSLLYRPSSPSGEPVSQTWAPSEEIPPERYVSNLHRHSILILKNDRHLHPLPPTVSPPLGEGFRGYVFQETIETDIVCPSEYVIALRNQHFESASLIDLNDAPSELGRDYETDW